jgi:DNA mismatch endonuclease (patch repair protein)
MDRIRSFGNHTTEIRLLKIFRASKISGWRRHTALPGRPDFAFKSERVAIFVDGCFWHGCPTHYRSPKWLEYWAPKLQRNQARDRSATRTLQRAGWKVIRLWEHALRDEERTARRLLRALEARR